MRKRAVSLLVLLSIAAFSFAGDERKGTIYIEGFAENTRHATFFLESFKAEAEALGYTTTNNKNDAEYTLKFAVNLNVITDADGTRKLAPPNEKQYNILIICVKNTDNRELVTMDYLFTNLEEMNGVTQRLFYMAAANIPSSSSPQGKASTPNVSEVIIAPVMVVPGPGGAVMPVSPAKSPAPAAADVPYSPGVPADSGLPAAVTELAAAETATQTASGAEKEPLWRSQWVYLRFSFNYSVTNYALKPDGLYLDQAIFDGPIESPDRFMALDNRITAFPQATFGLEIQFLPWISLEANIQAGLGDPVSDKAINMAAGAELKFPGKIKNFLLEPYAAFVYTLPPLTPAYSSSPGPAIGGGIQTGIKTGNKGVIFLDTKFIYYISDALLKNQYTGLYPNPDPIHYRHFALVFGLGYKHGFADRRR